MTEKLSISFKLTGRGWAACEILFNSETTLLTASYLEDALGNLAEATLRIAQGENITYAVFAEEPGEVRWKLTKKDQNELLVEIFWFDEWKGLKQSDDKGKLIRSFDCNELNFVRRVIICLSEVLNEYGLEDYKEKWGKHSFPLKTYNELRGILQELKQ